MSQLRLMVISVGCSAFLAAISRVAAVFTIRRFYGFNVSMIQRLQDLLGDCAAQAAGEFFFAGGGAGGLLRDFGTIAVFTGGFFGGAGFSFLGSFSGR